MPRHIWPEDHEFLTLPPSTSTSIRRWPSMRVIGSMTMRAMVFSYVSSAIRIGTGSG